MNVAVIPARGGSKRIPRKNIKKFCGKPMIAWPIDLLKKSGLFDHIIVSTDDREIADISRINGAEIPFERPAKLSDDFASTIDVMGHAVTWMQDQGWVLKTVCCIYPTSIFCTIDDLKKGFNAINEGNWLFAFSATDFEYPIFRSFEELSGGGVQMFFPEHFEKRSQDLPVALHDAAQFYWGTPNAWLNESRLFDHRSLPVKIPRWRVQDIDTTDDWKRAELIFINIVEKINENSS